MGKVLVTGADGFIGSHLTESLVRQGYEVKAFAQYNSFNSWGWLDYCESDVKGQFEVFSGDIRDPNGTLASLRGCDTVIHLAALIAIPFSYHSPDSYVDTNIKGTLNILQAARQLEIAKVVHTSTSEVYGSAQFVPITESHPLLGQSPYSATKIGADALAFSFYASFGLPVITLRPFNTYGPRQSARAVIPTIITQIASGQKEIKLGATHTTRDFNYIADTVSAFVAAVKSDGLQGEVINIGSNYEISIADVFSNIRDLMKADVELVLEAERLRPDKSEVERLFASNQKAANLLNWRPKFAGVSGLQRGLESTIDWFLKDSNLQAYKSEIYNL